MAATSTTTIPTSDITDDVGFKIWKMKTEFDVIGGTMQAIIVAPPIAWVPTPDKKYFVQICNNFSTGTFRWTTRVWFADWALAKAYITNQFKIVAIEKLYPTT